MPLVTDGRERNAELFLDTAERPDLPNHISGDPLTVARIVDRADFVAAVV